jgi:hypothetical protein
VRWLLVLLVACGGAPPPRRAPTATPEQVDFYASKTNRALEAFVTKYPESKYKNDALLELADVQFEQNNVSVALDTYRSAHFPADDDRGWYVRYRIAWCEQNLNETELALADMRAVANAEWTGAKSRAKLIEQAKKDLGTWAYQRADQLYAAKMFCEAAPLFAQSDDDEALYAYVLSTRSCEHLDDDSKPDRSLSWQRVGAAMDVYLSRVKRPEPAVRFMRAKIFYVSSRWTEAATVFRAIVKDTPKDETAPYAAALLLDCDQQAHVDLGPDLPTACAIAGDSLGAVCQPAAPTTSSRR